MVIFIYRKGNIRTPLGLFTRITHGHFVKQIIEIAHKLLFSYFPFGQHSVQRFLTKKQIFLFAPCSDQESFRSPSCLERGLRVFLVRCPKPIHVITVRLKPCICRKKKNHLFQALKYTILVFTSPPLIRHSSKGVRKPLHERTDSEGPAGDCLDWTTMIPEPSFPEPNP